MSGVLGAAACMGPAAVLVSLVDDTVSVATGNPLVTATATYALNSDGSRTNGTWLLIGVNTDYECRVTILSGGLDLGSGSGSWLSLGSNRNWSCQVTGGIHSCQFTIEIRRASDSVVIASATILLEAESVP
jgi:hypothetical protein